jgi:hypothetical protein
VHPVRRAETLGIGPGDTVLTSTFTLAPVPGAIAHAGARAVLVETTPSSRPISTTSTASSRRPRQGVPGFAHARPHRRPGRAARDLRPSRRGLVEDCAHTMGAAWDGRPTPLGRIGCFSAQTYKHINSGEGGCSSPTTRRLRAGDPVLGQLHVLRPAPLAPADAVFERWRGKIPNFSLRHEQRRRGDAAAAARRAAAPRRDWNRLHARLVKELGGIEGCACRTRCERAVRRELDPVLRQRPAARIAAFIEACAAHGCTISGRRSRRPSASNQHASSPGAYLPQPLVGRPVERDAGG